MLTAAHCIQNAQLTTNGFVEQIVPNEYYPSYASMYKVYLGFHDLSSIDNPSIFTTGIQVDVGRVIRVKLNVICNTNTFFFWFIDENA